MSVGNKLLVFSLAKSDAQCLIQFGYIVCSEWLCIHVVGCDDHTLNEFLTNLLLSLTTKEFWNLVGIWQSHG